MFLRLLSSWVRPFYLHTSQQCTHNNLCVKINQKEKLKTVPFLVGSKDCKVYEGLFVLVPWTVELGIRY